MRATIHQLLTGTPSLAALIPPLRWFQAGAVPDVPVKPFAVLRWISPVASEARGSFLHQLRVEVHDNRGSYARIDAVLGDPDRGGGVWGVLAPLADFTGVDGRITQVDYLGDAGDQEDPVYKTNFKAQLWQVIGRRLS